MKEVGLSMAIWYILQLLVHFITIWYILWPFGIFYGHLVYFMAIWYIFPVLVYFRKKNLATLTSI
jgi:hypothetical protein